MRKKPVPLFPYNAEQAKAENLCGEKLHDARIRLGLTQGELSQRLSAYGVDVKIPAISKWEKGENIPNAYQLLALCLALQIEDGFGYFSSRISSRLNAEGLRMLQDYQEYLVYTGRYSDVRYIASAPPPVPSENLVSIPFAELPASAGPGEYLLEDAFESRDFPADSVPAGADFAIGVHGDSMEPEYHDGQTVFVKRSPMLYEGQVGLFILNGSGFIKVYGFDQTSDTDESGQPAVQQVLISINKNYAPIPVHSYDDLRIVGRVLKQEKLP